MRGFAWVGKYRKTQASLFWTPGRKYRSFRPPHRYSFTHPARTRLERSAQTESQASSKGLSNERYTSSRPRLPVARRVLGTFSWRTRSAEAPTCTGPRSFTLWCCRHRHAVARRRSSMLVDDVIRTFTAQRVVSWSSSASPSIRVCPRLSSSHLTPFRASPLGSTIGVLSWQTPPAPSAEAQLEQAQSQSKVRRLLHSIETVETCPTRTRPKHGKV